MRHIESEQRLNGEVGRLKHELYLLEEKYAHEMAQKTLEIQALKARMFDLMTGEESEGSDEQ